MTRPAITIDRVLELTDILVSKFEDAEQRNAFLELIPALLPDESADKFRHELGYAAYERAFAKSEECVRACEASFQARASA